MIDDNEGLTSEDEFAWMDAPIAKVKRRVKKSKRKPAAKKAAKRVKKAAAKVETQSKIDRPAHRGNVMFQAVNGRKRIWACDGEYVFFRRKSCIDPKQPGLIHAAITRHQRFLDKGDYTYVETQDDVEICKVNPQSSFARKGVYLGELSEGGLSRLVILAACKRDWPLYTDALDELAGKIKGKWDGATAKTAWEEHLTYVDQQVAMRGGPTPQERGPAMARVREARGEGKGRVIMLPSR